MDSSPFLKRQFQKNGQNPDTLNKYFGFAWILSLFFKFAAVYICKNPSWKPSWICNLAFKGRKATRPVPEGRGKNQLDHEWPRGHCPQPNSTKIQFSQILLLRPLLFYSQEILAPSAVVALSGWSIRRSALLCSARSPCDLSLPTLFSSFRHCPFLPQMAALFCNFERPGLGHRGQKSKSKTQRLPRGPTAFTWCQNFENLFSQFLKKREKPHFGHCALYIDRNLYCYSLARECELENQSIWWFSLWFA